MNQYIITEEDICTIRDYILGAFYEGENKEKIYDLLKAEFSVVRSHPYNPQAEREKVLDEMLASLQNEGMAAWEERGYIRFIQSFRKGGE